MAIACNSCDDLDLNLLIKLQNVMMDSMTLPGHSEDSVRLHSNPHLRPETGPLPSSKEQSQIKPLCSETPRPSRTLSAPHSACVG